MHTEYVMTNGQIVIAKENVNEQPFEDLLAEPGGDIEWLIVRTVNEEVANINTRHLMLVIEKE